MTQRRFKYAPLFSGGNSGFVCTQYKVSETKICYFFIFKFCRHALVFYTRFGKLVILFLFFVEGKKEKTSFLLGTI